MRIEVITNENETAFDSVDADSAVERNPAELAKEKAERFKREWKSRYSSEIAERRHWKIMAFVELLIIIGLSVSLWDLGRRSRIEPYIVDRVGDYVGPMKPGNMDDAAWDLVHRESIRKFIAAWRTVTSDASAQGLNWDTAFAYVGSDTAAYRVLQQWYADPNNDPFKRAAKGELVTVQFDAFEPPFDKTSHTYSVRWTETTTGMTGLSAVTKTWHARLAYTEKIPKNERARQLNGLGFIATELQFDQVEGDHAHN